MGEKVEKAKKYFIECDADCDQKLNENEFALFWKKTRKTSPPAGVYKQLCQHYEASEAEGLEWKSIEDMVTQVMAAKSPPPTEATKSGSSKKGRRSIHTPEQKKKLVSRTSTPPPTSGGDKDRIMPIPAMQRSHTTNPPSRMTPSSGKRTSGSGTHIRTNESMSFSGGVERSLLTETALRHHEYTQSFSQSVDLADDASEISENEAEDESQRFSKRKSHVPRFSTTAHMRAHTVHDLTTGTGGHSRKVSQISDPDSSEAQILAMMETKLNQTKNQLKKEKQERKKLEVLSQELLAQNDLLKKKSSDLKKTIKQNEQNHQSDVERLERIIQEKKAQIGSLEARINDHSSVVDGERELKLKALSDIKDLEYSIERIKSQHEQYISKIEAKHKDDIQKVSNGFLQSLGLKPGDDIREEMKKLRERNDALHAQVNMLAETLSRKEQSLLEALKAVDEVSHFNDDALYSAIDISLLAMKQEKEKAQQEAASSSKKSFLKRFSIKGLGKSSGSSSSLTPGGPTLRSAASSGSGGHYAMGTGPIPEGSPHSAAFYKGASTDDSKLQTEAGLSSKKHDTSKSKDMEFLSKSLASDVAMQADTIDNISRANQVLVTQVADLQRQLGEMRRWQEKAAVGIGSRSPDRIKRDLEFENP